MIFVTVRPSDPLQKSALQHDTMIEVIGDRNDTEVWNRIANGDQLLFPRS